MSEPITEEWLRATGFKWEQLPRQPSKHWILWLAPACVDPDEPERRLFASSEDLGIEIARVHGKESWHCWLRADYAGRYSRFLHVRHLTTIAEVVTLMAALTGRQWTPEDVLYGAWHAPEVARRMRAEAERLDRRIAAHWGQIMEGDPSQRGLLDKD